MKKILSIGTFVSFLAIVLISTNAFAYKDTTTSSANAGAAAGAIVGFDSDISNKAKATGGKAKVEIGDTKLKNKQGQEQSQEQSLHNTSLQLQGQHTKVGLTGKQKTNENSKVKESGNSEINLGIEGDNVLYKESEIPVNIAYISNLSSQWGCALDSTAGVSTRDWAFSFGRSGESQVCKILKLAAFNLEANKNMTRGDVNKLVNAIQCQEKIMEKAFKVTGHYSDFCVAKDRVKRKFLVGSVKPASSYNLVCDYPNDFGCRKRRR